MSDKPKYEQCPVCEGAGKVRMEWNEVCLDSDHDPRGHTMHDRFKDEWCKGCDGEGRRLI